jgi:hypothetical protein
MVRFNEILAAYFVIGALMWGGGAIAWDETGVGQLFVETPGSDLSVNEETTGKLEDANGPIQESVAALGASPLLAVWNIIVGLIGYISWPVTVLQSVNAPPRVTVLAGGTMLVLFFGAVIRLLRTSG